MKPKRRQIRLTYTDTGESVIAEMLDDEAPGVCAAVWNLLPIEKNAINGQYSGAEVFTLLDDPKPVPRENLTQLPLPGELLYFYDDVKYVANHSGPVAEICVVYHRGVVLRGPESIPTHCCLFARIPGDWKYDWTDFQQACRRVRREGPRKLRIERVEEQ